MATKAQTEELKATYKTVISRTPEEIKKIAVAQRDAAKAKLDQVRTAEPFRWKWFDTALDDIAQSLSKGDALAGNTSAEGIKDRKTLYGSAWLKARQAGIDLDREITEGKSAIVDVIEFFGDAATTLKDAAGNAGRALADTAGQVGSTAKTVVFVIAGAASVALLIYAFNRSREKKKDARDYRS